MCFSPPPSRSSFHSFVFLVSFTSPSPACPLPSAFVIRVYLVHLRFRILNRTVHLVWQFVCIFHHRLLLSSVFPHHLLFLFLPLSSSHSPFPLYLHLCVYKFLLFLSCHFACQVVSVFGRCVVLSSCSLVTSWFSHAILHFSSPIIYYLSLPSLPPSSPFFFHFHSLQLTIPVVW